MSTEIAQTLFNQINAKWAALPPKKRKRFLLANETLDIEYFETTILKKIEQAFSHLQSKDETACPMTVRLWEMSDYSFCPSPKEWDLIISNGYHGTVKPPIYLHYFADIQALSVINTEKNLAYYLVKDASQLPWWVSGSPLQVILNVFLRERKIQLTHSGAVSLNGYGILLFGKGGAGKSTTTLSCVNGGMECLGEDYCALAPQNPPTVYSVYQTAKLTKQTIDKFPNTNICASSKEAKHLFYYNHLFPKSMIRSAKLKALIHLNIGKKSSPSYSPINKKEALAGMLLSTLSGLPLYQKTTIDLLSALSQSLPCFRLHLGSNLEENTKLIRSFL